MGFVTVYLVPSPTDCCDEVLCKAKGHGNWIVRTVRGELADPSVRRMKVSASELRELAWVILLMREFAEMILGEQRSAISIPPDTYEDLSCSFSVPEFCSKPVCHKIDMWHPAFLPSSFPIISHFYLDLLSRKLGTRESRVVKHREM